jgi:putative addiction module component (TIGR02574 family)
MEQSNWRFEFEALDRETKICKPQELWDSIASDPESVWLTPSQRDDLERRLAEYRESPNEISIWDAAKARILSK